MLVRLVVKLFRRTVVSPAATSFSFIVGSVTELIELTSDVEAATVPPRTAAPVISGLENPLPVFKRLKISLPCSVISFIKHL